MKCIQITSPGRVEIVERRKPALTPGHAVVRTRFGGICGSDIGSYRGTFLYAKYPLIPGHEFSGEIVGIGRNEQGLKNGMIVTANPYFNCGVCDTCKKGFVNCCPENQTMGCSSRSGAFCEYVSLPVERIYDGKGMPARTLALIEPFCIGYHAVKRAAVGPGDRVLVVGAGTIGYLAGAAAKMLGAEVYMADIAAQKLENAKKLGLSGVILNDGGFAERVGDMTGGNGFDVCIEAVGLPETVRNCIDAAAFHGRVVIVGVGRKNLDFFYPVFQTKELSVFGSRNALKEDFLELIDYVGAGRFDLGSIVSAEYSYLNAARAFEETAARGSTQLKVMFSFEK